MTLIGTQKSRLTCLAVLAILLSASCTHQILRSAYTTPQHVSSGPCGNIITRELPQSDSLREVGQIELKDGGFSTACSEAHAIKILKNEACDLDAQIIHIVEERRPDRVSSCYRCKARFYQSGSTAELKPGENQFAEERIQSRASDDKARQKQMLVSALAYAGGFILGFTLVTLLLQ